MTVTVLYITASTFIIGPSTFPSLNGRCSKCGPVTRRERCRRIGIRYETYRLTMERDDCVESGRAANVDETEEGREDCA